MRGAARNRGRARWITGVGLWLVVCGPACATEIELFLVNDFLTNTPWVDDVYSAALGLKVSHRAMTYSVWENMFTDRGHDLRFDETYLTVERRLPSAAGWEASAGVGVMHVGQGLLGERFQNWMHSLINNEQLDLAYVDETGYHAVVGFDLRRPFTRSERVTAGPWVESYATFDYKWDAAAGGFVTWRHRPRIVWYLDGGVRFTGTNFLALEPWVDGLRATAEAGVRIRECLGLAYSYNHYGTGDQHFRLTLRFKSGGKSAAGL